MPDSNTVDHAAIKTGQLLSIAMLIGAFGADRWEPVALLAVIFLLTSLFWQWGPFTLVYRLLLKPLGWVRADVRVDNTQSHQFGQAIGALSAALAAVALYAGYTILGWGMVWILIALTALSFMGWCIGCFIYFQLYRLGLGGFFRKAPTDQGVVPGARPRKRQD